MYNRLRTQHNAQSIVLFVEMQKTNFERNAIGRIVHTLESEHPYVKSPRYGA